jgi:hypothetical protein
LQNVPAESDFARLVNDLQRTYNAKCGTAVKGDLQSGEWRNTSPRTNFWCLLLQDWQGAPDWIPLIQKEEGKEVH